MTASGLRQPVEAGRQTARGRNATGHGRQKKAPEGFRGRGGGGNPAQSLPLKDSVTLTDRHSLRLMVFRLATRLDFPRRGKIAGAPELGGSLGA